MCLSAPMWWNAPLIPSAPRSRTSPGAPPGTPLGISHGTPRGPPRGPPRSGILDAIVLLCVLCLSVSVGGLRITELRVPRQVDVHDTVTLVCLFDLQGSHLQSVKWYKDDAEFYRFMPAADPSTRAFPQNGIALDLNPARSYDTQVTLVSLSFNTSGSYMCEISTEAPSFITESKRGNMSVVALPREKPYIQGVQTMYDLGNVIAANCTSDRSYPPATLQWYINGKEAERWQTGLHSHAALPRQDDPLGLQASTLGLRFEAEEAHFPQGRLELKCRATVRAPESPAVWERVFIANLASNQKMAQMSSTASGRVLAARWPPLSALLALFCFAAGR